MALFRYRAFSSLGKEVSGVIDADSVSLAKERLRRDSFLVTEIGALKEEKREIVLSSQIKLGFTRELSQLLKAGLPLYESLLTLTEKQTRQKAYPLFLDLCDSLKEGLSFSACLKKYPKTFDPLYLSIVQAGEKTGSLAGSMEELSLLISRGQKLKKQLLAAVAYPAFLSVFCFIVVIGLFFFVIPTMRELFEGRTIHPLTQIVISTSDFLNEHVFLLSSLIPLFLAFFYLGFKMARLQKMLLSFYLKVPFLKTILLQSALIRFSTRASLLLSGGISFIEAFTLAREGISFSSLQEAMEKGEKAVMQGGRLSDSLATSPVIPHLMVRMIAVGEETGRLSPMLKSLSEIYEEKLERDLQELTTFLQPALLLLIGAIVGLVLLSILLPLTDVSSFLSS